MYLIRLQRRPLLLVIVFIIFINTNLIIIQILKSKGEGRFTREKYFWSRGRRLVYNYKIWEVRINIKIKAKSHYKATGIQKSLTSSMVIPVRAPVMSTGVMVIARSTVMAITRKGQWSCMVNGRSLTRRCHLI